tara:strand:- start:4550 stop:5176 length:627 start_codon:yes stop_codon:yes gene_type:complete
MIVDTVVIVVSLLLLAKQIFNSEWVSVFVFVGVMMALYVLEQPNYICVGIPGIIVCLMVLMTVENFENKESSSKKIKDLLESDNENKNEETDDAEKENVKITESDDKTEEDDDNEDDDEDDYETPSIDIGKTFRDAYANLNPKQINDMTKDTKELVKTQTNLIATLQNLEPVVKQGISLLDKFQGEGSTSKMFKEMAMKTDLKNLLKK